MNLYTYSGIYLADNQKLLIPTVNCNGLFAISKANQSQYLGIFNEASHPLAWMIVASHQIDREIYFFSFYQFCFWKFNLDTKKMEFVEYYKCDESFLVTNVELVNNQFWIFSNITTIPILIYDCYTGKVSNLSWDCITDHEGFPITKSVVYENKIFFATRKINNVQLAIVDCARKNISYKPIVDAQNIDTLTVYRDEVWLLYLHNNGKTVVERYNINDENGLIITLEDSNIVLNDQEIMYYQLIMYNNSLYAFSTKDNHILKINVKNANTKKIVNHQLQSNKKHMSEFVMQSIQKVENGYLIYSPNLGYVQLFNIDSEELKSLNFMIDSSEIDMAYNTLLANGTQTLLEKNTDDMEYFFNHVVCKQKINEEYSALIGYKIYNSL